MNITERILEVYQDCVKAGLEVKLILWSKGGNDYFSFSKTPGPQTQSQSWKRRMRRKKALGTHYTEARSSETRVCEEGRKRVPYFDKTTTQLPLKPLNLERPVNATYSEVVKTVNSFESPAVYKANVTPCSKVQNVQSVSSPQRNKTPQPNPVSPSSTSIPQIDGGHSATPEHPETEPSDDVPSLPTIHDSTHPTPSVNTNLNHILFLTIPEGYEFTPFDIDTSFIYQICKPHGEINKIVMIERYRVYHALVEFKTAENALDAKTILDNTELFPDEPWSTTLDVEFSFHKELKIEENIRVEIARDFTKNPM